MSIAVIMPRRDTKELVETLEERLPEVPIQVWPELEDPASVRFAVLWQQPPGVLAELPALEAATSYGAGVEGILEDPTIPEQLPIGRIVDPGLVQQMSAYLLAVVLGRARELQRYREDQTRVRWSPRQQPVLGHVGLLGYGQLGRHVAGCFQRLGWTVSAWRREVADDGSGVRCFNGREGLYRLASEVDYLICLLPLTPETRAVLDRELFRAAAPDCYLVNVGRGAQLVEEDLLAALEREELAGACLDVFGEEPLPPDHAFWHHPRITITPHVAAITPPAAAARQIAESYRRVEEGRGPLNPVDRHRGY